MLPTQLSLLHEMEKNVLWLQHEKKRVFFKKKVFLIKKILSTLLDIELKGNRNLSHHKSLKTTGFVTKR